MNLYADDLNLPLIVLGWLFFISALLWAVKSAPWYKVKSDLRAQHVLFATVFVVFLVWQFSASIAHGLTFHFLLMPLLTLMFGVEFAIIGMSLALMGVVFQTGIGLLGIGVNAILMGLIPIFITQGLLVFSKHYLVPNFFVFVLFNAFLSGAIGSVISLSLGAWLLWSLEVYTFDILRQSFIPFIPLMAVPEGFLNGFLIGGLILFKPSWVSSFNFQAASELDKQSIKKPDEDLD